MREDLAGLQGAPRGSGVIVTNIPPPGAATMRACVVGAPRPEIRPDDCRADEAEEDPQDDEFKGHERSGTPSGRAT
jgi:hypothetical protein